MPVNRDPNLLVGPEHHSDSGAYRVGENIVLLQTVDFFPPLTDDPFVFGQIAAANSLSDIYAMGGRPITALNIVAFPDHKLPLETLSEILRGGADKAAEAGAAILGGHSVRDEEIKFGLSVTGVVEPDKMSSNAGARAGDVLVLTKPIGTGAMTAAYRKNQIGENIWNACCASMLRLNKAAAVALVAAGAKGSTDVTGFGLLGHASEMAEASGVTIEIEAAAVPLLEGAAELSRAGFITRAVESNRSYLETRLEVASEIAPWLLSLLIDAQTSGGLLIALPESALDTFATEMKKSNQPWSRIGRVAPAGSCSVRLL